MKTTLLCDSLINNSLRKLFAGTASTDEWRRPDLILLLQFTILFNNKSLNEYKFVIFYYTNCDLYALYLCVRMCVYTYVNIYVNTITSTKGIMLLSGMWKRTKPIQRARFWKKHISSSSSSGDSLWWRWYSVLIIWLQMLGLYATWH